MKFRAVLSTILLLCTALVAPVCAHGQSYTDTTTTFAPLTAPGSTALYSTIPDQIYGSYIIYPKIQVVQAFVTGSPTACSFQLYGSTKRVSETPSGSDLQPLGTVTDCTTTTLIFVVDQPVPTVQIKLIALSGGTTPAVTFRYLGKRE